MSSKALLCFIPYGSMVEFLILKRQKYPNPSIEGVNPVGLVFPSRASIFIGQHGRAQQCWQAHVTFDRYELSDSEEEARVQSWKTLFDPSQMVSPLYLECNFSFAS